MSFQRPEFLLALLLALLPAAFYLSRYVRSTRTVFPAAPYLFGRDRAPLARLRSRQIIATLLRAAIICLAALAFAGPILPERTATTVASVGDRQVIVVDLSRSMLATDDDGRSGLQWAVAKAREIIEESPPSIRYAVVPCPRPQEKLLWLPAKVALATLDSLEATPHSCHAEPLLRQLSTALEQTTTIHAFIDLQADDRSRDALARLVEASDQLSIEVRPASAATNRTLARTWVDGANLGLLLESGGQPAPASTLTLSCQDDTRTIAIPPSQGEAQQLTVPMSSDTPATLCRVQLADDGFLDDNGAWFTVHGPEKTRVFIIDGTPGHAVVSSPGELLAAALRAGDTPVNLVRLAQTEFSFDSLDIADLLVFVDPRPLPRYLEKGLFEFMAKGGHAWFFAGSALADWADDNLLFPGLQARRCLALPEQPFKLAWFSSDHPATSQLNQIPEGTLRQWTHERHIAVSFVGRNIDVLARFDDGVPTVLRAPVGRGEMLLWSLVPYANNGNFALHPAFPLTVQAFLAQLARPTSTLTLPPQCTVGLPCRPNLATGTDPVRLEGGLGGDSQLLPPPEGEIVCPEPGPFFQPGPEGRKLAMTCLAAPGETPGSGSTGLENRSSVTDAGSSPARTGAGPLVNVLLLAALGLVFVELWMVSGRLKDRYEA